MSHIGAFWTYVSRGDLLLVSAVVGGSALGELVGRVRLNTKRAVLAGGGLMVAILSSAMLYPFISMASEKGHGHVDSWVSCVASTGLLTLSTLAGAICIWTANGGHDE